MALVLVIDNKFRQTLSSAVSFYFAAVFFLPHPFSEPEPGRPFWRLRLRLRANRFGGSGSGSDKNVSAPAAPTPAPAPHPCLKCYSARLNSLTPRINLNLQRRHAELSKKSGTERSLRGPYHFIGWAAVANQLAAAWMWLAGAMPLSTVHSNSLLYFLLFCEIHDLVWEIISVSEKKMKNCIVKIIDNVFEKWRSWVISFNCSLEVKPDCNTEMGCSAGWNELLAIQCLFQALLADVGSEIIKVFPKGCSPTPVS